MLNFFLNIHFLLFGGILHKFLLGILDLIDGVNGLLELAVFRTVSTYIEIQNGRIFTVFTVVETFDARFENIGAPA